MVSTLPPQSEASSMSGINRSSECSPITVSDGQANSTLLSFPRKTGLSECVLALEIILEASWHASEYSVSLLPVCQEGEDS